MATAIGIIGNDGVSVIRDKNGDYNTAVKKKYSFDDDFEIVADTSVTVNSVQSATKISFLNHIGNWEDVYVTNALTAVGESALVA